MSVPSTSLTTTASPDVCHVAVETDECYGHVLWAMETGINSYPSWYPDLSAQSSFVDFQAFLHQSGHGFGTCPQPCRHGPSGRQLADIKNPRGKSAPSPGAVAEISISVPLTTSRNASTAAMRALGQTLLGLDDSERELVKFALSRTTQATSTVVTFVASVPAERASSLRVKTAEDLAESLQSLGIVPASDETVKSYLLLSDVPHQVVAIIVSTVPGGHHDLAEGAYAMAMESTTASMLRGATTVLAKSSTQSRLGDGGNFEANGATGHSSIVFAIVGLVCSTVALINIVL